MNIANYNFNSENQKKIEATLLDGTHPFYKIENKIISIYSGKFKTYEDANKLLGLTKLKYQNAKVFRCGDNVIKYVDNGSIFNNEKMLKKSKIENLNTFSKDFFYSLQVLNVNLDYDKNRINTILKKLPNSYIKIENKRLKIYSGKFKSIESAKIIKGLVEKEYKDTIIIKIYNKSKENQFVKKNIDRKNTILEETQKKSFDVYSLDEIGLIPQNISSAQVTTALSGDNIARSDIDALNTQSNNYLSGLYLKVNSAWDVLNDTVAYDTRLEFNIFNQGYYEKKNSN